MTQTASDFLIHRINEWGIRRIYGYPGDGINGIIGAIDRAGAAIQYIQVAAVEVLEAAEFEVVLPGRSLCCGRPLYDFGFLRLAKNLLRQILETLHLDVTADFVYLRFHGLKGDSSHDYTWSWNPGPSISAVVAVRV